MVAGTVYAAVLLVGCVAATFSAKARDLIRSDWVLVPLCLLYGYALVSAWEPDTLSLIMPGDFKAGFQGRSCVFPSPLIFVGFWYNVVVVAAEVHVGQI